MRRIEAIGRKRNEVYGGKAESLAALARARFPVPAAYAVSGGVAAHVARQVLGETSYAEIVASRRADPKMLADTRAAILRAKLPPAIESDLRDAFAALQGQGVFAFAVRSSSTVEDQAFASAAGLHHTTLGVRTFEGLLDAIRQCWASFFDERVLAYLRRVGGGPNEVAVGVVIQAMVPAQSAGVVFTANPLSGDPEELVVNATHGLGVPVVDGRISPDTYRIDKRSRYVRDSVIGHKPFRVDLNPEGGVHDVPLDAIGAAAEALTPESLRDVIDIALRIEEHFGDPRDVEFAVTGGAIYVLQARPITTGVIRARSRFPNRRAREQRDRARLTWSNANVGEALPGVATPLTWSVLSAFSELGFRRALGAMGCSVPDDAELFGAFRGRIYLNLTELFQITSQIPGFSPELVGVLGGISGANVEVNPSTRERALFAARLPLTVGSLAMRTSGLAASIDRFEHTFDEERLRFFALDLRVLSPVALSDLLRDVEGLLDRTGAVLLNTYGGLLAAYLSLRTLLTWIVGPKQAEAYERGLTSGLADLDSSAPGLALWHISEMARVDDFTREAISSGQARVLEDLPDSPTRRALERFLQAYGFRGPREAEIAAPRWREDPRMLFGILGAYLRMEPGVLVPSEVERKHRELREKMENDVSRRLPPLARTAARHLLAVVQRGVRMRERLRARTTEVLGFYRAIALEASSRFLVREPNAGDDAAFYLSVEELHIVLRQSARAIAPLVRARRIQFERDVALPDPPPTFTGFPPPVSVEPLLRSHLVGVGASPGVVTGIARVVRDPIEASALVPGEILVAPHVDVGWSPFFLASKAVVVDLGGTLSHAAIIAREYDVPCVMNVKIGTRVIQSGDTLRVDGDTGEVHILERR